VQWVVRRLFLAKCHSSRVLISIFFGLRFYSGGM
jgi:hypothetical protein